MAGGHPHCGGHNAKIRLVAPKLPPTVAFLLRLSKPTAALIVFGRDILGMEAIELRPCPFCAHDKPIIAAIGDDDLQFIAVTCPECGAIGPRATSEDAARVETIELRPCFPSPRCADRCHVPKRALSILRRHVS